MGLSAPITAIFSALCGCSGAGVYASDQHVHIRAHRKRGGDDLIGGFLDGSAVVFGNDKNRHDQSTPASFFSLSTSSEKLSVG